MTLDTQTFLKKDIWIYAFALAIRLFLMPITMHDDLIFIHYFPYFLSYRGIWDIYGYFGGHYLSQGFTYYPPMVYYVVAFFQWALHPVNPFFDALMAHAHTFFYAYQAIPPEGYLAPFSRMQTFGLVFWMKFPYLLTDVACIFLILPISRQLQKDTTLVADWLFHPVLLFSIYIFGQYRIFSAFLMWLLILLTLKNKRGIACVVFGLLCLMENYALYLGLPVLLILADGWRERIRFLAFMALSPVIVLAIFYFHSGHYVVNSYFSPVIAKTVVQGIFRHGSHIVGPAGKTILISNYLFMIIILFKKKSTYFIDARRRFDLLISVNTALFFALYAVSVTMIHYFMWVLPFYLVLQNFEKRWTPRLNVLLIALLFLFNLDSRELNLGLLKPLDPGYFMAVPSFHEWVTGYFVSWGKVIALSRLFFSVLCLYFMGHIYVHRIKPLLYNRSQQSKLEGI